MTVIEIIKKNEKLSSVKVSGHTGYNVSNLDIVCSAISSVIQTAGLGLKKYLGKKVKIVEDSRKPMYEITLEDLSEQEYSIAEIILETAILGLKDIASGYSKIIKVEEKSNVN